MEISFIFPEKKQFKNSEDAKPLKIPEESTRHDNSMKGCYTGFFLFLTQKAKTGARTDATL